MQHPTNETTATSSIHDKNGAKREVGLPDSRSPRMFRFLAMLRYQREQGYLCPPSKVATLCDACGHINVEICCGEQMNDATFGKCTLCCDAHHETRKQAPIDLGPLPPQEVETDTVRAKKLRLVDLACRPLCSALRCTDERYDVGKMALCHEFAGTLHHGEYQTIVAYMRRHGARQNSPDALPEWWHLEGDDFELSINRSSSERVYITLVDYQNQHTPPALLDAFDTGIQVGGVL